MLGLACVYMLSTGGHVYSVDEYTMLATTHALVQGRRQVAVTPATQPLLAAPARPGERVGVFGIGMSAVAVPALGVGNAVAHVFHARRPELISRLLILMSNAWMTAATAAALLLLCLELGASLPGAAILAAAYGLGTGAWVHAKTFFSEPAVALLLTLAVLLVIRAVRIGRRGTLVLAGACVGTSLFFRVTSAIYLPPLLVYAACVGPGDARERVRRAVAVGSGLAAPLVVLAATNWWRYGDPLSAGYRSAPFTTSVFDGVPGLLVSPGKGLFLYAPITLLAVAVPFVVRRGRAELALLGGLVAVDVALFARFAIWYGGTAWGPRYLYPVLPLIIAALALVIDRRPWRRWAVALAVVGGAVTLSAGVSTYAVAVAWRDLPRLEAEVHATQATDPRALDRQTAFVPHDSPIVLGIRYLPDAIERTVDRIAGPATPPPSAPGPLLHYYDTPLQLDTWWAWWLPSGGWPPMLALVPVLIAGAAFGIGLLIPVWRDPGWRAPTLTSPG